ncbi:MAG TPA: histone deacetylase [Terriglobales bacterium]
MRRLFYTDQHTIALPPGHKFPISKYSKLRSALTADGSFEFVPAPLAAREVIEHVHDVDYVEQFLSGTLPTQVMRRIGFPWSEGLVRRTLASVGGTLAATREALDHSWGGTLAGGTHHAFRAEGSGFCVFNDIAIAIEWLRREQRFERVAVVDCDVHQGDGTAQIFDGDEGVFTLSLHGRKNFPFRKRRSRLDIELEDGTGDDDYLAALKPALDAVFAFRPQFVFFQSGVDPLAVDRLGRLALTHEGLKRRDQLVLGTCREQRVPVAVTLGGGYSDPIEATVQAHANTFRTAHVIFDEDDFRLTPSL